MGPADDLMPPPPLAEANRRIREAGRERRRRAPRPPEGHVTVREFFSKLRWLDGRPLLDVVEPYRMRLFEQAFDEFEGRRLKYNLVLSGRAKKNWKSSDLVLGALLALLGDDSPGGNQCYLLANDADQAADDLVIAKKVIRANPKVLGDRVRVLQRTVERRDGLGFLEILPAGDVVGSHGKTYRYTGFDEIHGYRDWDLFEAMQPDPTRGDAQQWITSYASIYHRPGVPLYDLTQTGKSGKDPRMLFSWYAADLCTDPALADRTPEERANPSMGGPTWDPGYLAQQAARLPAHKYRRLHLNLPGLPEGSAFSAEKVMGAVERGVSAREPEPGRKYLAWVDMSGGSSDDATLCLAHADGELAVVDLVVDQGPPPPFDPGGAVNRFCATLARYNVWKVHGDDYAGQTFKAAFASHNVAFARADLTASELYEALEVPLNARRVVLPDVPKVEQLLLGLVWRGARIDHPPGEHDDWANAVAGAVHLVTRAAKTFPAIVTSYVTRPGPWGAGEYPQNDPGLPPELVRGRYFDQRAVHPHERREPSPPDPMSERKRRAWGGG